MPKDFNKPCDRASNALASRACGPDFKFRPVILRGFMVFLRQIPGYAVELSYESSCFTTFQFLIPNHITIDTLYSTPLFEVCVSKQ